MSTRVEDVNGVWRTIGGRRVFIRTGQSVSDAMKESGKFNNKKSRYQQKLENKNKYLEEYKKKYGDDTFTAKYYDAKGKEIKGDIITGETLVNDYIKFGGSETFEQYMNRRLDGLFSNQDETFIKDLTEHYDEFTRGDLQGTIEAKYGMGEKGQAILREVDDRTYEKYKKNYTHQIKN